MKKFFTLLALTSTSLIYAFDCKIHYLLPENKTVPITFNNSGYQLLEFDSTAIAPLVIWFSNRGNPREFEDIFTLGVASIDGSQIFRLSDSSVRVLNKDYVATIECKFE